MPLRVTFGVSAGLAAFFPSIYSAIALGVVVLSGYVQDQLTDRGYTVTPVFIAGSAFVGVGSLGASYSRTFPGLLVNSLIMGAGIGFTGFGASGILAPWFVKRSSTYLLLGLSGGGLGGFTYALLFEFVLNAFHVGDVPCTTDAAVPSACEEWRPATRYVGIPTAVLMLLASMFMRLPRPGEVEAHEVLSKKVKEKVDESEVEGVTCQENDTEQEKTMNNVKVAEDKESANVEKKDRTRRLSSTVFSEVLRGSSHKAAEEVVDELMDEYEEEKDDHATSVSHELSLRDTLRTRTALCILCWSIVFSTVLDSFYIFVPSYAESAGLSSQVGALSLSLTGATLLLGNLTLGVIADRVGHTRCMQMCMLGLSVVCIIWPFTGSVWSLLLIACLLGYFMTCTSLFIAILMDRYAHTSKGCILTLIGLIHAVQCPGLLVGPAFIGYLIERFSFFAGALFTAAGFFASFVAVLLIPSGKSQDEAIDKMFS
eukprot:CAMPEP_0194299206 /NCGR_PEP_ID=MMETSP0169-20130528/60594_1 /TAXON_ID=218684 /ORGANISM="Corethron pennatum, Strain L29A3" /LENGTH=483 /DNA_ID=CAMNT_0039049283 /DNA_START=142 /DNA_END=1593 /DNA_ORIENTATION=-